MLTILILGTSILIQVLAAILAIRLIKVTRAQSAWVLIAIAVILMAVRRSITLYHLVTGDLVRPLNLQAEIIALTISILMAVGIALIGPLFISLQQSRQSIREREQNLSAMADNADDGILISVQGTNVFANKRAETIFNCPASELLSMSTKDVFSLFEDSSAMKTVQLSANKTMATIYETVITNKDGSKTPVEIVDAKTRWNGQEADMSFIRDISLRKQAETQTKKLSSALEQTADSVIITDPSGKIEYVNPAFEEITGFTQSEAIGKWPNIIKSDLHDKNYYNKLWKGILKGEIFRDVFINRKKNGDIYYEEKTISPLKDKNGTITSFISTGKDITERMHTQERLHYLAYHDVLTGLANRSLFMDRLEHAISKQRDSDNILAVFFLDLDQFKNINDTLGHEVGDQLLRAISNQLQRYTRKGDTIARLGGDEFVILLEDIPTKEVIPPLAQKLIDAMSRPFMVKEHELFETVSIGISTYPSDGNNSNVLLKNADTAMYRAKDRGRNNYKFYSADMGEKASERLALETDLRHALERNEFSLHYQPQIDINTNKVIGTEALIRWNHPEKGMILPSLFIPILEETGMIVPIGEWVLKTACTQNKKWQKMNLLTVPVSVNLSSRQFHDKNLVKIVEDILTDSGLNSEYLDFEITESVLMQNVDETIDNMETLNAMGIKLSIDDFGTGYSSLSYLKHFNIDTLKIDRGFVRDITTNTDDASIVNTIVSMAHNMNLSVIAEGVETEEQAAFLKECSCDALQGYLYSKPVPESGIKKFIQHA